MQFGTAPATVFVCPGMAGAEIKNTGDYPMTEQFRTRIMAVTAACLCAVVTISMSVAPAISPATGLVA